MRPTIALISSLLLACLVGGCESSSGGAPGLDSLASPAPGPTASGAARLPQNVSQEIDARFQGLAVNESSDSAAYQVGPRDVLSIAVFQVPELNMDAQVAANGTITLPLIGIVKVGGKQVQQVNEEIAGKLRAKYLQSPQVTVFVKAYNSQKVVVSGEVRTPGTIAMNGDTTLMSAIADARGLTDLADQGNVMVFRRTNGQKFAARFNVKDIQSGKLADPRLQTGDVVFVDTNDIKSWMKTLLPLTAVAGLFVAVL